MRNLLVSFFTLMTVLTFAQSKGKISGVVKDKDMGLEPLPFVSIYVEGNSSIGTTTDFDGNYVLPLLPGKHTIIYDFVGYKRVKKQIDVVGGKAETVAVVMESLADALEAVILTVKTTKESEEALVEAQKEAVEIVTAIGAEELSKKGVSDVAAAVTKAAGVTKEESGSGSIFVRGLGDRYNVTTLNGLPLPSNNPSTKNISLDIFSTDIVEYVGISKTFEVQNYADFGGANIDINSKKFSGNPYLSIGVGFGANQNVLELDNFYLQEGPGYFGFSGGEVSSTPNDPLSYGTSWDRVKSNRLLNNSFSLSGGRKVKIGDDGKLNLFMTASFDNGIKYKEGIDRGGVTAQGFINSDFYKKEFKYSTNSTLMGTANYKINTNNSLLFTSLFLNSSSQKYAEYEGESQNFDGGVNSETLEGFAKRSTFDRTQLLVNQLVAKHELNDRFILKWAAGYNILNNEIPDRMQNTFVPARNRSENYTFFSDGSINNHRYYQELGENEFSSNISLSYKFNENEEGDYKGDFTLGYAGRFKTVGFESVQYGFKPELNKYEFSKDLIHNVDAIFKTKDFEPDTTTTNDVFQVLDQEYNGELTINAAFAKLKYAFNERLTMAFGARLESIKQDVTFSNSTIPEGKSNLEDVKVLPSLVSKFKLNDKQNLKFAFSQTYTLPQFKEKVPLPYEEVAQVYNGNPYLKESTNYNIDLGWELYPKKGELVSINGFGKIIQNPINEIFINSASGDISYANTGNQALAVGVEFELKKNLFLILDENSLETKLSGGLNASYIHHNQDVDPDKIARENPFGASPSFKESKLAGASDVLVNADISFSKDITDDRQIVATLSYGYFSDKLAVIGTLNKGNHIDKAVNKLDFIAKYNLTKRLKLGLSYKNILNPEFKRIQDQSSVKERPSDDIVIRSYKLGSNFSLSLNYKF